MAITSYGDISPRVGAYAVAKFLSHAGPVQVLARLGQIESVPLNKGQTVKFRRMVPYAAVTAPLVEGVTPSVKGTTVEDVTCTLQQWGDLHGLTDVIQDTHEDPLLDKMMMLSGQQAAATFEQIIYNVVKGGTAVAYANGAARTDVNTVISLNKQRGVIRTLQAAKARKFTSILSGSPNIGTTPVEAAYVAIAHTDLGPDIRNLTGFTPVAQYGSMKPLCAEEIGSVEDVRYILTPDLASWADGGGTKGSMYSTTGTSADVYPVLYFGEEAFGCTPLKNQRIGAGNNMVVEPTVLNPGTKTKDDPLGQRGFVGWKAWFQAVRLNETWMKRLEVAVTAL
jgi:N4-gp56 family major capsid protein